MTVDKAHKDHRKRHEQEERFFHRGTAERQQQRLHAMEQVCNNADRAAARKNLHVSIMITRGQKRIRRKSAPTETVAFVEPDPENGSLLKLIPALHVRRQSSVGIERRLRPRSEQNIDSFLKYDRNHNQRDQQRGKNRKVRPAIRALALDNGVHRAERVRCRAKENRTAALRKHHREHENAREYRENPAVLLRCRKIEGRRHANCHYAADIVIHSPTRKEQRAVNRTVNDHVLTDVQIENLDRDAESDCKKHRGKIPFFDPVPMHGIIKIEVKERKRANFRKPEERGFESVIAAERAAEHKGNAERAKTDRKHGEGFAPGREQNQLEREPPEEQNPRNDKYKQKLHVKIRLIKNGAFRIGRGIVVPRNRHIPAAGDGNDRPHIIAKKRGKKSESEIHPKRNKLQRKYVGERHDRGDQNGIPYRIEKPTQYFYGQGILQFWIQMTQHD